jgi:hypothetical protein
MANVEEGINFDLEKNAQVNQLTSSYDPKLRLMKLGNEKRGGSRRWHMIDVGLVLW